MGVREGSSAEVVVPLGRRELARDDGGPVPVAIFEDLEEVAALGVLDGGEAPVVEDEDVEAGELGEQADLGAVGAGQGEVVREAGGARVVGAVALSTGLVREGAREKALPHLGGADEDDVLMLGDPPAGGELADEGLIESRRAGKSTASMQA